MILLWWDSMCLWLECVFAFKDNNSIYHISYIICHISYVIYHMSYVIQGWLSCVFIPELSEEFQLLTTEWVSIRWHLQRLDESLQTSGKINGGCLTAEELWVLRTFSSPQSLWQQQQHLRTNPQVHHVASWTPLNGNTCMMSASRRSWRGNAVSFRKHTARFRHSLFGSWKEILQSTVKVNTVM